MQAAPEAERRYEQDPGVVKCANCGVPLRVEPGSDYICPNCNTEFSMIDRGAGTGGGEPAGAPPEERPDFGSLIVECVTCKSLIRIKRPGAFRCPDCSTKFFVGDDQTIAFD